MLKANRFMILIRWSFHCKKKYRMFRIKSDSWTAEVRNLSDNLGFRDFSLLARTTGAIYGAPFGKK